MLKAVLRIKQNFLNNQQGIRLLLPIIKLLFSHLQESRASSWVTVTWENKRYNCVLPSGLLWGSHPSCLYSTFLVHLQLTAHRCPRWESGKASALCQRCSWVTKTFCYQHCSSHKSYLLQWRKLNLSQPILIQIINWSDNIKCCCETFAGLFLSKIAKPICLQNEKLVFFFCFTAECLCVFQERCG